MNLKRNLNLLAAATFTGIAAFGFTPAGAATRHRHVERVLPVCATDDSVNCVWSAGIQGNGRGHSFVAFTSHGKRCVVYLEHWYARTHDGCWSN